MREQVEDRVDWGEPMRWMDTMEHRYYKSSEMITVFERFPPTFCFVPVRVIGFNRPMQLDNTLDEIRAYHLQRLIAWAEARLASLMERKSAIRAVPEGGA